MITSLFLRENVLVVPRYFRAWARNVATHSTGIVAYNSLTKCKMPIVTKSPNVVTWYVCGPTVYDSSHIGHAWCYVNFDIMRRVMENYFGLDVVQVMNVTDIDDKIIAKSEEGVSAEHVALTFELDFLKDMSELGVMQPTVITRVTNYMQDIISFIDCIIKNELAYVTSDGSVYFNLNSYTDLHKYGKLKPADVDGTEVDGSTLKKSPRDFALWKGQKYESEPSWEAPWGKRGRPGWHIECSAMASHVFGSWLDIHSGGIDLAFPHHENEEAQCCAYHNVKQWVGHWIHTKHLRLSGDVKMSKSLKNTITIRDFLETHSADVFRMLCVTSNYRSDLEYSDASLNLARDLLNGFQNFLSDCRAFVEKPPKGCSVNQERLFETLQEVKSQVRSHLADDFNTSQATTSVRSLIFTTQKEMMKKPAGQSGVPTRIEAIVAVSKFVSNYLQSLGFTGKERQVSGSDVMLKAIVDDAVGFRIRVRQFALALDQTQLSKVERRKLIEERRVLVDACDDLRRRFDARGVRLKDHQMASSWSFSR